MLQGKNISLRALTEKDWKDTIRWRNDLNIKKLAMMHPFPVTELNEKEWYDNLLKSKSDRNLFFAVCTNDGQCIGFVSLNNIHRTNRNCYLSIVIGEESAQGKGYGKEAMQLILNYAFEMLNLNKLSVEVLDINEKALRLYEQLGFVEEGHLKHQFFCEGIFHGVKLLSLFKTR
jgi:UDP-4-amino-4,6-dideoxy-N-acetyl-beta-L-altrosamine N-acetyltransferase